jgi:hypothetical protein
MADGYRGVVSAFPYAARASGSWVFRSYVVVGGLATLAIALVVVLGLVVLIGQTASIGGGSLTLSRAFYVVVGLFVVAPLIAPVLLVARRHRTGRGRDPRYDAAVALAGYLFLASLYVGLVITVPPAQQTEPTGALAAIAPAIRVLYDLPQLAGLAPPAVAAAVIAVVHRAMR